MSEPPGDRKVKAMSCGTTNGGLAATGFGAVDRPAVAAGQARHVRKREKNRIIFKGLSMW
jgi:hypothetical protein